MFGFGPAMTGGLFGLGLGVVNFVAMQAVAGVMERQQGGAAERAAGIIRLLAYVELFAFPVLGYLLGPVVIAD